MFKSIFKVTLHTVNVAAVAGLLLTSIEVLVPQAQAQTVDVSVHDAQATRPKTRPAVSSEPAQTFSDKEMHCLAQNIFFEARNQSTLGQVAVAWVTLNRVMSNSYNDTICDVVQQGPMDGSAISLHRCQFSWFCDGKSDVIPDNVTAQRAWEDVQLVASVVVYDFLRNGLSPVDDAVMYHANYVQPFWMSSYDKVVTIDDHLFYN